MAFQAIRDDSIIYYDERIAKNFRVFFYKESLNYFNYDLYPIKAFTELYSNKLSKTYYDADFILIENSFYRSGYLTYTVTKELEDFNYINGIISEAFKKKDFYLVQPQTVQNPAVRNRVFGNTGGRYDEIESRDNYPFVII